MTFCIIPSTLFQKQMLSEYETGKALWDVLEAMIVSLNSKFKVRNLKKIFAVVKSPHLDGN